MSCNPPYADSCPEPASWVTSDLDEALILSASSIGFFGPKGTFTEEALRNTLRATSGHRLLVLGEPGSSADPGNAQVLIPYPTLPDTIEAVSQGEVDCAIVPIENSIEGTVSVTVDLLAHEFSNLQVVREVRHAIRHRLIVRRGVTLDQITKVFSHPHANAQCRGWLRSHLPGIEIEPANSTAGAVERVATATEPWAAIGNALAAEEYGCVILADNIEDHDDNETRFIFLARQRERQDLPEDYKTSLVCEIARDQPGALLLILQEFAYRYINLTKIESRPAKRLLGEYIFLIDVEGRIEDGKIADALRCLSCKIPRVTVLGSYPVGLPRMGPEPSLERED